MGIKWESVKPIVVSDLQWIQIRQRFIHPPVLRNRFIPVIQSEPGFQSMWFIQDSGLPHGTNEVFHLLEKHFHDRNGPLEYTKSKNMALVGHPIILT